MADQRSVPRLLRVALGAVCGSTAALLLLFATGWSGVPLGAVVLAGLAVVLLVALRRPLLGFLQRHRAMLLRAGRVAPVVAAASGAAGALALYAIAAQLLRDGPDAGGWQVLLVANRMALWTAAGAAAAQPVLVLRGAPRARKRTAVLALLAATTAVPVAALVLIGGLLSRLEPTGRPVALDAVVLAMVGTGRDLAGIPVAFAIAAALMPVAARVRPVAVRRIGTAWTASRPAA